MLCKWCGMESSTTDSCSWCRRPFSAAANTQRIAPTEPGAESRAAELGSAGSSPVTLDSAFNDSEESPLASGRTAPPAPRAQMMPGAAAPSSQPVGLRTESTYRQDVHADRQTTTGSHSPAPSAPLPRPPYPGSIPAPGVPFGRSARVPAPTLPIANGQEAAAAGNAGTSNRAPQNLAAPSIPVIRTAAGATAGNPAGGQPISPAMPVLRTPPGGPVAPGGRPGSNGPSPGMPTLRSASPDQNAPRRDLASPEPPAHSVQNRGRPLVPDYPPVEIGKPASAMEHPTIGDHSVRRPGSEAPQFIARSHAASIAHGMPTAEPGGLADGMSAPRTYAESHLPAMESVGTEQSKYYPGKVVDSTSGTHYDAVTGRPLEGPRKREAELEIDWEPVVSMPTLVMRYLCAFAGVVGITCLLAHAYKENYVLTLLASLFFSGVLLPIMDVVPKQRDDSEDAFWFAGLVMVFGPTIGLIIYMVIGIMKQSVNPAIVGCFIVSILLQLAVYLAAGQTRLLFGPPWVQTGFDLPTLFINWSALASLAGWAFANVFHRFDE